MTELVSSDDCKAGLFGAFAFGVLLGLFTGGCAMNADWKAEAVKRKAAEWRATEDGDVEFSWKEMRQ